MIASVSKMALFANSPALAKVEFAEDCLQLTPRGDSAKRRIECKDIRDVTTTTQLLHSKLTVTTHSGQRHSIGGLNKTDSEALSKLIQASADSHREAARRQAQELSATIIETDTKARLLQSPTHYLRHTTTTQAVRKTVSAAAVNHGFEEEFISPQAKASLAHIRQILVPEGLEPERRQANDS